MGHTNQNNTDTKIIRNTIIKKGEEFFFAFFNVISNVLELRILIKNMQNSTIKRSAVLKQMIRSRTIQNTTILQ
jgi:hypothetical protein